jgi:hypothetical protein
MRSWRTITGNPECMVRRPVASEKVKVTGWSAQMYAAFVGAVAPGQDGMRCVLLPISLAVLKTSSGYGFSERRVRPLCHLIVRQQTWQENMNS